MTVPAPPTSRVAPVDELFHGENVPDPYRWLEDDDAAEVREWTDAQNAFTAAMLGTVPGRDRLATRLTDLLSVGTVGTPTMRGERLFYERRAGGQNQPVLLVRDGLRGEDRVLIDPNALSAAGTVALDWYYPSEDGRLLAYGLSTDGSELSTLYLLDVDSGMRLPDTIDRTRYTSLAWLRDGSGFYYTRLPVPESVPEDERQYHRRVYLHQIGSDPNGDRLIWSERRDLREQPDVQLSRDGRWLVLSVSLGWSQQDVYLRDLAAGEDAPWIAVAEDEPALFGPEVYGETLYLITNLAAPRYRVLSVPLTDPRPQNRRELVAERQDAILDGGGIVGGRLALRYIINASSRVELHRLDGGLERAIGLPALGTVGGLSGEQHGHDLFLSYTSFTTPVVVYHLDLDDETGTLDEWASIRSSLDPAHVGVEQVWYDSTDGTRVSMFIVARRETARDGAQPLLLTGYGGFNISRTPQYSAGLVLWLELGGVYALPNLRGGGEYGEDWHRAGMLDQKQHTFDDFIAAAEYLIATRYTSTARLAILGGSNGGLLVGAAITQRPDLFRAAVCAEALLDMLRFQHFLIARLWVTEYGSSAEPEQYRWLKAYSPYHRVRPGTCYPAVLLTTATSDSRVAPLHARKMAALLQAAQACDHPVLLRVESQAGHGQGKPIGKIVEAQTDIWSFLCEQLAIPIPAQPVATA